MFFYQAHQMQQAMLTPWRFAAGATQAFMRNPFFPTSLDFFPPPVHFLPYTFERLRSLVSASAEVLERSTRRYGKPTFGLRETKLRGKAMDVQEEVVLEKPFCNLLHFKRVPRDEQTAQMIEGDPRVLIMAPISGHHATLLRGTVEALLPEHDVYITDWIDARQVPLSKGKFDLDDNIDYFMDFCRHLGRNTHVIAVCQPSVPVLAGVALMAEADEPAQPLSMTLMGGPIDTQIAKTAVTEYAKNYTIDHFKQVIETVPFGNAGFMRAVYPGYKQLQAFVAIDPQNHFNKHQKFFEALVKGDEDSAEKHRRFYDEYMSVVDSTAEFYIQTIERVFQNHDLPKGQFWSNDRLVKPECIHKTALLVVEGELDDISGPGQTAAALDLCSGLPEGMKQKHLAMGVGHYGIFSGKKWRGTIQPLIASFIRQHNTDETNLSLAHGAKGPRGIEPLPR